MNINRWNAPLKLINCLSWLTDSIVTKTDKFLEKKYYMGIGEWLNGHALPIEKLLSGGRKTTGYA